MESSTQIAQRFQEALDSFIETIKTDPNIIAVILAGSLAYDKVWHKSDMDLTVLIREQRIETKSYCVSEDNLVLNVNLEVYSDFKRSLERGRAGEGMHSMYARAKVVYTADESLYAFLDGIREMGESDIAYTFFNYASWLIGSMEKVEKWLVVRKDVRYAQLYLTRCASTLADMYLIERGIPNNRESILRVMEMDPDFMYPFYVRPLEGAMTEQEVTDALRLMRTYLEQHLDLLSIPALSVLEDGELKTVTTLVRRLGMHSHGIYHIFDFLCEMGLVEKVSETIRLTPKSRKAVEEAAFILVPQS